MKYGKLVARGTVWTSASTLVVAGFQLAQMAVLARLLSPYEYGQAGLVMVFIGFGQIFVDAGVSNAIIQRQEITQDELASLYWLNIGFGLLLFIAYSVVAWVASVLFLEPSLFFLIIAGASIFLIVPFGQQFQSLLQRNLQFNQISMIEIVAAVSSFVAAYQAASIGLGPFAVVVAQISYFGIKAVLLLSQGWKTWRPRLVFRTDQVNSFIKFGMYQLGERLINYVNSRLDQIALGIFVGPIGIGIYNLAFNLAILPISKINSIVTRVTFPVFSRIHRDENQLQYGYLAVLEVLSFINVPLLAGLAALAPQIIPLVFGEAWVEAVPIVQVLSLVAILRAMANPVGSLALSKGRADLSFKFNVILFFFYVPAVIIGVYLGGSLGVALAVLILQMGFAFFNYYFMVVPLIGHCGFRYLTSLIPVVVFSGLSFGSIFVVNRFLQTEHSWAILVIELMIGMLVTLGTAIAARRHRVQELITSLR